MKKIFTLFAAMMLFVGGRLLNALHCGSLRLLKEPW